MKSIIDYAFQSRRFWWFNASSRTKARFRRTVLGSFWLGLSTVLSTICLAVVYSTIFNVDDRINFALYIGFGLCFWNTLSTSLSSSPTLFEVNRDCLHNTNLPIVFYLLQEWAFTIQSFIQTFAITFACGLILSPTIITSLPSLILPLFLFLVTLFWLPALICIGGARFQDLYQLIPVAMTLLFLLSPLLYYEDSLGSLHWVADFNPIYQTISVARDSLIGANISLYRYLLLSSFNVAGLLLLNSTYNKLKSNLKFMA